MNNQNKNKPKVNAILNALACLRAHTNYGHKRRMLFISVMIFLSAVMDVVGLAAIIPLMKFATEPAYINENFYTRKLVTIMHFSSEKSFLFFLIMMVLVFFLFKSIFGLVVNYLQTKFTADVASFISKNQFSKYYSLNFLTKQCSLPKLKLRNGI